MASSACPKGACTRADENLTLSTIGIVLGVVVVMRQAQTMEVTFSTLERLAMTHEAPRRTPTIQPRPPDSAYRQRLGRDHSLRGLALFLERPDLADVLHL